MVALAGTGWRLAPSLVALVAECDRIAPNRSTASDGSIGDLAHAARTSDHNPSGGYVCAVDITDDKPGGLDADLLARHIVASRDPRVKYVIWNGTIVQAAKGWRPETYTGSNSHFQHTHVSIHNTATARNDKRPWFPQSAPLTALPEDDMALILRGNDTTRPARLLAGPLASRISSDDRVELEKKGVPSIVVDDTTYDAMKGQLKQLGLS